MIAAARPKGGRRGKSGLHRAGCRITSGGGDSKASATEIYRRDHPGKGGKAAVRDYRPAGNSRGTCKPHPKQDRAENDAAARRVLR